MRYEKLRKNTLSPDEAVKYSEKLTTDLMKERKLSQRVSKSIAGVEENAEVISEYQQVE